MNHRLSEARERVLHVAEQLFSERGYMAVTLRDIANTLHMKQASLYNHAPGGKEELFITVTERNLARHRAGIEQAIMDAGPDLRAQLHAIAHWLLTQPPTNLQRMTYSDMPAISPGEAERLSDLVYQSLLAPIVCTATAAADRGDIRSVYAGMLAGTFLVSIESIRELMHQTEASEQVVVGVLVDLLLDGARPR